MEIIVCNVCGSSDVELKAWVKPNEDYQCTHPDDMKSYLSNPDDCYCKNCGENVTLKIIETEENKDNDL